MDDKKRLIALLSVLSLSLVGGGIWLFLNLKGDEVSDAPIDVPIFSKVDSVKNLAKKNISYINSSSSLINSFYRNARYKRLKDTSVEVVLFGVGNAEPFAPLAFSSTTEVESE